jgi:hypothetical protein
MRGMFWLAEDRLTSEEGLCSTELVTQLVDYIVSHLVSYLAKDSFAPNCSV